MADGLACPVCKKPMEFAQNPHRPFCSERCKTIDLGNWLSGDYRIPREMTEEDLDKLGPPSSSQEPGED